MFLELLTWYIFFVSYSELSELLEFSIISKKRQSSKSEQSLNRNKVLVGNQCFHACCNNPG